MYNTPSQIHFINMGDPMKKLKVPLLISLIFFTMMISCDMDTSPSNPDFIEGIYDHQAVLSTQYETDLTLTTYAVLFNQNKGEHLAQIAANNGYLELDDGTVIKLVDISKNECPSYLNDCDTIDSDALGIGPNAMIFDIDNLSSSIRNQGDRGTCLAFALSGAIELMVKRDGTSVDISEQNTYFLGKKHTNSWDYPGLNPYQVIDKFTYYDTLFVEEQYWPYNSDNMDCTDYAIEHPGFTCSPTEAQGGGDNNKQQEPKAAAAPGYFILQAHQLYASVGRIKEAIYRGYPVILSLNANIDFTIATRKDGVVSWVFKESSCDGICGHAVLAIGYQDDPAVDGGGYVIIKNSWGSSWGYYGFAFCTYEWLENSILDAQAVTDYQYTTSQ